MGRAQQIHELASLVSDYGDRLSSDAPCLLFTGKVFKIAARVQYEFSKYKCLLETILKWACTISSFNPSCAKIVFSKFNDPDL